MKTLKKIKLINWHRFINVEINLEKTNLLSGENGAGKTTLLDAIQYVLIASSKSFNSAAHVNGKRKVTTYVRSKTGKENNAYERQGNVTAHIALEFFEESNQTPFVIGCVIDSSSETQETTIHYIINKKGIDDIEFINNGQPLPIREFRKVNDIKKNWFPTQKDSRIAIANRLGRLENRFFDLIPKATAFKPIDNIKEFVYTYVLDEKSLDIDELREIVSSYKSLEQTLNNAKIRLKELEQIIKEYNNVQNFIRQDKRINYFIQRARTEELKVDIQNIESQIKTTKVKLDQNELSLSTVENTIANLNDLIFKLKEELSQNSEHLALMDLQQKEESLKKDINKLKPKLQLIKKNLKDSLQNIKALQIQYPNNNVLINYQNSIDKKFEELNLTEINTNLNSLDDFKKEQKEEVNKEIVALGFDLEDLNKELAKVDHEIYLLEQNKRTFPNKYVEFLYNQLKTNFKKVGKDSEPHILCEILEITDEKWRNAVEGYLNTQRFYILVDPEDYNYALSIYDLLRKQKKIYGVGLINAANLQKFDEAKENSLASVVTSNNIYARRFINSFLNRVTLCNSYKNLKNYPAAITKTCIKYQNRVATVINPKIYETPWIGQESYKVQLEKAKESKAKLEKEIKEKSKILKEKEMLFKLLNSDYENYLTYNLISIEENRNLNNELEECITRIQKLEENKTLKEKNHQLRQYQSDLKLKEDERNNYLVKKGSFESNINNFTNQLEQKKQLLPEYQDQLDEEAKKADYNLDQWSKEYKKALNKRSFEDFIRIYQEQKKRNRTQKENAITRMTNLMTSYSRAHDFGAPASLEGFKEFQEAYNKIQSSEILEYESQIKETREKAEIEFKEQFLSNLQENIKQAQTEFRRLNNALKKVKFSNERYRFTIHPNKEYMDYYEMIMDPSNVGVSLFTGDYYDRHKETIRELFDRITFESDDKEVDEITDYRRYLDFDIEIIDNDGSISYYSKVFKEKSGGEIQTPFYVTIAASFVQLYGNSLSSEAPGIMMFDEAFNNMDDERISGVLEFLSQLPLQVIIAAPPDKIQYIAPYSQQTLIVSSYDNQNDIFEFNNSNLDQAL